MDALWHRIGNRIAEMLGLHFPPERWDDLQRALGRACHDLGFPDGMKLANWLVSQSPTPSQWKLLASHLTVGETYFFREKPAFEFLRSQVLPRIVASRGPDNRRVRLWSAGCCTGEEAYSLAIAARQTIPDFENWNVTILATDINERFLQRAHTGIYRDWSFREPLTGVKQQYFTSLPAGHFAIHPDIKRQVTFANLNLVEDNYPSITTDTNAMDVIFCRNVLMYFTPEQARKVVAKMRRALVEGGWLVVSAVEGSSRLFPDFSFTDFPGIAAYQKLPAAERRARSPSIAEETFSTLSFPHPQPPPLREAPRAVTPEAGQTASAKSADLEIRASELFEEGHFSETAELLLAEPEPFSTPLRYSLLAQSLANLGRLPEALTWCDRWVALDKLNPSIHYLRAMTLQELGRIAEARQSLQRAIYLQPAMVAAHFSLGNLARAEDKSSEAARHFGNALRFLSTYESDAILPEAGGLTAGRLNEIITSLSALETTR